MVIKILFWSYGQTGSGKTYTVEGPNYNDPDCRGLLPRSISSLFDMINNNTDVISTLKVNYISRIGFNVSIV